MTDEPTSDTTALAVLQPISTEIEAKDRLSTLQRFVKAVMVPGEDFGTIPGTPKPTLYKSGAEKLLEIYGLGQGEPRIVATEDWETPFFQYIVTLPIIDRRTGNQIGVGLGSCNSRERKYLRQANSGGAGDLLNTLLKMAKKRALVDATLSVTRSSGLFTQDIEDLDLAKADTPAREHPQPPPWPNKGEQPVIEGQFVPAPDYTCEVCQKPLEPITFKDGNTWSPSALAAYGRRKHGKVLCMPHYRAANTGRAKFEDPAINQDPYTFEEGPPAVTSEDIREQLRKELEASDSILDVNNVVKKIRTHQNVLNRDDYEFLQETAQVAARKHAAPSRS